MIRTTRLVLLVAAALVLVSAAQSTVKAGGPYLGYGSYGYGLGYYGLGGPYELPYAMGRIPTPPYFAIHPPVYYSHTVPRTYGHSPFAYPGSYRTPEVEFAQPVEVINPHVESEPEGSLDANSTSHVAVVPTVIRNPFVEQTGAHPSGVIARTTNN